MSDAYCDIKQIDADWVMEFRPNIDIFEVRKKTFPSSSIMIKQINQLECINFWTISSNRLLGGASSYHMDDFQI